MEYIKVLGILMVLSGIAIIPSQYNIVQTLKKNGQNASMFIFFFSDVKKYKKLMKEEFDVTTKFLMTITLYGFIIPVIVGLLSVILIILILILNN